MAKYLFGSDHEDSLMSEINMTPLVDVMLVLLIIFMVTLPVMQHETKVDLPRASNQPQNAKSKHIKLIVRANGAMFWEQQAIDQATLQDRLVAAAQANPAPELHLYVDRAAHYEYVAQIVAAAQTSGLTRISLVTEPKS